MRFKVIGAAVLLIVGFATNHAHAQRGEEFMKGRLFPPKLIMMHRSELNLSERQTDAIKAEIQALQAKAVDLQWDMQQVGDDLNAALDQVNIDEEAVLARVDEFLAAENSMKRAQLTMLIRIRNLLEPEQVEYLRSVDGRDK